MKRVVRERPKSNSGTGPILAEPGTDRRLAGNCPLPKRASCYWANAKTPGRERAFSVNAARRGAGLVLFLTLLGVAAVVSTAGAEEVAVRAKRSFEFCDPGVSFRACFPGARLDDCIRLSATEYRALIRPENEPINDSAWYAFQVTSEAACTIAVRLTYQGGKHRYHPKISRDGLRWTPLGPDAYARDQEKNEATLRLDVGPEPLWIAGQELITSKELNGWADRTARLPFVHKSLLARSVLGKPIYKLEIGRAEGRGCVFLIGRQHPPEVTGSLGLMRFVETLVDDTELARRFRARFSVIVVPLVNPDGVDEGHWRHNMNGVDLNRDWGTFDQPETRALRDEILKFEAESATRLYLFLDFHSTHHDVFYTQADDQETTPSKFAGKWLDAIQERFPDYELRREGTHGTKLKTSKRWVYEVLGIPSITYEFGDHTDRRLLRKVTNGAAEEMMRLLLEEVDSVDEAPSGDGAAAKGSSAIRLFDCSTIRLFGCWEIPLIVASQTVKTPPPGISRLTFRVPSRCCRTTTPCRSSVSGTISTRSADSSTTKSRSAPDGSKR